MTAEYTHAEFEKTESMIKIRKRRKRRKGKVYESIEERSESEVEKRQSGLKNVSEAMAIESEEIDDCIEVRSELSWDFRFIKTSTIPKIPTFYTYCASNPE